MGAIVGSALPPGDCSTQLSERRAQIRVSDVGDPLIERLRPSLRRRRDEGPGGPRRKRQWPLNEREAGHGGTAKKQVDSFDDQRRAVLQLERGAGRGAQLQAAV